MKIFVDTSVLVAGSVREHPHNIRSRAVLHEAATGKHEFLISAHSVGEVYSALTNLPLQPRITPIEAQTIIANNIIPHFQRVAVTAKMYETAITRCTEAGLAGGIIYDAILLECARRAGVKRIYTLNERDFRRLAPDLASVICVPL